MHFTGLLIYIFIKPYKVGYKNLTKAFANNNDQAELSTKKRIFYLIKGLTYCLPIINSILYFASQILFSGKGKQKILKEQKPIIEKEQQEIEIKAPVEQINDQPFYIVKFDKMERKMPSYDEVIKRVKWLYPMYQEGVGRDDVNVRHQKILNRIEKKLQDAKYQEAVDAGRNPEITLDFEDFVCFEKQMPKNQNDEMNIIIRSATNFLQELEGVKISIKILNKVEVIQKANNEFADDVDKEAIVKRIEKRLEDENYQKALNEMRKPEITLNFEDTLTIPSEHEWNLTQRKIIQYATAFLKCLPGVKKHTLKLNLNDVMLKADKDFANNDHKEAIVKRIEKRLNEEKYQEAIEAGKPPKILFHWEDTLWAQHDLDDTQRIIISAATDFIDNLPGVYCSELK